MKKQSLKEFLDKKVDEYNQPFFIKNDPISIPHLFKKRQDIEIAGFFAAIFAWGNRTTIINKATDLMQRMDMAPHDFCVNHESGDLKRLLDFRHRTFTDTDLLYFVEFFRHHYTTHDSLEPAFAKWLDPMDITIEKALVSFREYFLSLEHIPPRTRKHIASPARNSTCKRLNMFLRWMVRKDDHGVDFGLWENIHPSMLVCPIDLHVARVAKRFHLLRRKPIDWLAAMELTTRLRALDKEDPVKYDFALFGLGAMEKF